MEKLTYRQRVKRYIAILIFILIVTFLKPREYPPWAVILPVVILIGTILYNIYKWKINAPTKASSTFIYNNAIGIIIIYCVFKVLFDVSIRFTILYFLLAFLAATIDYFLVKRKWTTLSN